MILNFILSFMLHHWGWLLAGLGALMAAGLVMHPAASLALFSKATGRALGWLREPHDWWRIGFLSLAVVAATVALYAHGLEREIIIVREQQKTAVASYKAQLDVQAAATKANADALDVCKATLTAEVGKRKAVEAATAQAVSAARATAAAASLELNDWRTRYAAKPATCTAALLNMESACGSLKDY